MINPKKYKTILQRFVLLLLFSAVVSCGSNHYYNNRIEGKKIPVTQEAGEVQDI